jgi:hypothetical protein
MSYRMYLEEQTLIFWKHPSSILILEDVSCEVITVAASFASSPVTHSLFHMRNSVRLEYLSSNNPFEYYYRMGL